MVPRSWKALIDMGTLQSFSGGPQSRAHLIPSEMPQRGHMPLNREQDPIFKMSSSQREDRDRSLHIMGFRTWKGEGTRKCAAR